jgi:4-amino-4-deoxy-L-arabinose transferase-like glycosyltransferase
MLRRRSPWRASLWLIAGFSAIRLLVGGSSGLSVDEAHYALYGLHPDWSYFDHPPLIGWLQALVLPFSESTLALRVLPVMLFAATGLVLYRLTRSLFPQESPWLGFISVALLQSGLMFQLIGIAMLPDTPLLLLGLLVLWVLQGALTTAQMRYWLALGLLLGLAALSKYTAITLVATVLISMAFTRQWRQLLNPAVWLAMLLAALVMLPILYWNARHDWISFLYQLHHGTGNLHWQASRFLLSEAAQLLVYGFGVVVFGVIALVSAARDTSDTGVR